MPAPATATVGATQVASWDMKSDPGKVEALFLMSVMTLKTAIAPRKNIILSDVFCFIGPIIQAYAL